MDSWFIILISLCLSALLKSIFNLVYPSPKLPPGPPALPFFGNFLWLRRSFSEIEPVLRNLHPKYGPIVTLQIGSRPALFVANRSLAHQALIQNGALFADRPPALPAGRIMSSNQHNISSAAYGPKWRLFRRNLTSEILHPSRVKSYSPARKWVLEILIDRFKSQSESGDPIRVVDHFRYAMFCLLVFMCFGNKVKENEIKEIETVLRRVLLSFNRFNMLNIFPRIGKVLFRKRWEELFQVRKSLEDVLIPLIRARKKEKQEKAKEDVIDHDETEFVLSYVDTLLDLELPDDDEKRKLEEGEMASLCSEFLNAGTDTTSTALEWIMANMVKYPNVQAKLVEEIKGVVGLGKEEVEEEDLEKMPYLKGVILEGLRRHPPGHFLLPHAVTRDVTLDGYVVPKHGTINFMVAEMGWDPKVWEDPMEFKPERFLAAGEVFDITGSREIKMMPFGAGRRICPGYGLAMLHLEYFVANLVWYFEWTAADGDEIDLSEKQEFTIVMKNPLRAHLSPRLKLTNN